MRRPIVAILLIGVALLPPSGAAPLAPPTAPLCRVQVTSEPHALGRVLTARLRPECPPGSVARVRLESRWGGSQPDNPPGVYTLHPSMTLRRVVLAWWWMGWLDASGRSWRVPETP